MGINRGPLASFVLALSHHHIVLLQGFPNPNFAGPLDLRSRGHRTLSSHLDPRMTSPAQPRRICCTSTSGPPIDPCVMVWSSFCRSRSTSPQVRALASASTRPFATKMGTLSAPGIAGSAARGGFLPPRVPIPRLRTCRPRRAGGRRKLPARRFSGAGTRRPAVHDRTTPPGLCPRAAHTQTKAW